MASGKKLERATLGFATHTGWAAMIAVAGPAGSPSVARRGRVDMILGSVPGEPPYVYHAAAKLDLRAAERMIAEAAELSTAKAGAALAAVLAELREEGKEVV